MARVCNVCHHVHDDDDSPACADCIERGRYARKPRFPATKRACIVCGTQTEPGKAFCSRKCELEQQERVFSKPVVNRRGKRAAYYREVLASIKRAV